MSGTERTHELLTDAMEAIAKIDPSTLHEYDRDDLETIERQLREMRAEYRYNGGYPDEPLPFEAEYEIGVHPAGHPDDWEHYHPRAKTMDAAKEKALSSADSDGMSEPMVYMATGPFPPENAASIGEEALNEVFGQ